MNPAKRIILSLSLASAALGAIPHAAQAEPVCYEDQPCFNWAQDGNGARGVILTGGRKVVVSACRYQRLYRADRISARTPRLKGDHTARSLRCGS